MDEYRALEQAMAAHAVGLEALAATPGYGGRGYGRVGVRILEGGVRPADA